MNYVILQTKVNLPDVLLYRDRDEEGKEIVIIKAIGSGEIDDYFAIEEIAFQSVLSAQNFINDFSVDSANKWCEDQNIIL